MNIMLCYHGGPAKDAVIRDEMGLPVGGVEAVRLTIRAGVPVAECELVTPQGVVPVADVRVDLKGVIDAAALRAAQP